MVFSIGTFIIAHWIADAYSFSSKEALAAPSNMSDFIYYTFITYTTTGYDDLLPVIPLSRSFAVLVAACGQLYIATIIALLVGKYTSDAISEG